MDRTEQLLLSLRQTCDQVTVLSKRRIEIISQLRDTDRLDKADWQPVSWAVIAKALGVSRQAAWALFSWLDDDAPGD